MGIKKTIVTVTVLHDDKGYYNPFEKAEGGGYDLADIAYFIGEGEGIGEWGTTSTVDVPADQVVAELLAVGNDGTFFDVDDDYYDTCGECGHPIEDDPDGSAGVVVHARSLGDTAFDLDADHTPPAMYDGDDSAVVG